MSVSEVEYPEVLAALQSKPKAVELLASLDAHGGSAELSKIKAWNTEWETYHIDYRVDICAQHKLVRVSKVNEGVPGKEERMFTLNERGAVVLDDWRTTIGDPMDTGDSDIVDITRGELTSLRKSNEFVEQLQDALDESDDIDTDEVVELLERIAYIDTFLSKNWPTVARLREEVLDESDGKNL